MTDATKPGARPGLADAASIVGWPRLGDDCVIERGTCANQPYAQDALVHTFTLTALVSIALGLVTRRSAHAKGWDLDA